MYKKEHIHFVGIGGIGMSAIAKILRQEGYRISGCDIDLDQQSVKDLQAIECNIYKGNNTVQCNDKSIDVLVYSSAIKSTDEEILNAQSRAIPTISRAQMLSELMRTKYSIAITGSHGKTTTTSLISHILIEAQRDPTVIIGGHLKNISANARRGKGNFIVAEADESDRSLLRLYPTLAVVTNINSEHLDTYLDIADIKNTFIQFLNNLPFYGKAFVCIDDPHIQSILPIKHVKIVKYGFDEVLSDVYAKNLEMEVDYSRFDLYVKEQFIGKIHFNMPGRHNILNALASIAVAQDLDISLDVIQKALMNFRGIERRFSLKCTYRGAEIFDDYGHHPTEIFNTLLVARKRAQKKLIVIFQPHRFTRTQKLWEEFVNVFAYCPIDHLVLTDIYPAFEAEINNITSANLVKAIKEKQPSCNISYIPYESQFEQILAKLNSIISEKDLILLLGAGRINRITEYLV